MLLSILSGRRAVGNASMVSVDSIKVNASDIQRSNA